MDGDAVMGEGKRLEIEERNRAELSGANGTANIARGATLTATRMESDTPSEPQYAKIGPLAVVVPIHNNATTAGRLIDGLMAKLPELVKKFVVIAVEDGAHNQAREVLAELERRYRPYLQIVQSEVSLGYGAALQTGFAKARADGARAIAVLGTDDVYDISNLSRCFSLIDTYDAIVGYRVGTRHREGKGALNLWQRHMLRKHINDLFGIDLRDPTSQFWLLRADFVQGARLQTNGALANVELAARLHQAGLRAFEVPVKVSKPTASLDETTSGWFLRPGQFHRDALLALRERVEDDPISPLLRVTAKPGDLPVSAEKRSFPAQQVLAMPLSAAALVLVICLGAYLRLHRLAASSLWTDELGEGTAAKQNLQGLFAIVRSHAGATPLDYLGVKFVITFFGATTYTTRLWACALGIAAVGMIYLLCVELFRSRVIGLLAAFFLAMSGYHVYYSQEARFYALLALMTLVNLYTFHRAMRRRGWLDWALFSVVVAVGFYAHYYLALLLPFEGVYLVLYWLVLIFRAPGDNERKKTFQMGFQQVGAAAAAMIIGVVLFLPWLRYATAAQAERDVYAPLPPLTPARYMQTFYILIGMSDPLSPYKTTALQVNMTNYALVAAALGLIFLVWRRQFFALVLATIIAIATPVTWEIDTLGRYFFDDRQTIFILPLLAILAAAGAGLAIEMIAQWLADRWVRRITSPEHARALSPILAPTAASKRRQWLIVTNAVIVLLGVLIVSVWAPLTQPGLNAVYSGSWRWKEDWRDATAVIDSQRCTDSRYFSYLPGSYEFGIGYYDAQLMPNSYWIYRPTGSGTFYSLDQAVRQITFYAHDWLVLPLKAKLSSRGQLSPDAYLLAHGWLRTSVLAMFVYHQPGGCSSPNQIVPTTQPALSIKANHTEALDGYSRVVRFGNFRE